MLFLIFLRVGAILMSMPIFNSKSIPILVKLGLALAASIVLYPLVDQTAFPVLRDLGSFAIGAAAEILLGISIGMAINLIFVGLQMAGQISGYQMGLAIAQVMDPSAGQQVPLLSQFFQLFAFLIFLTINAHHWFLMTLVESFQLVPPLGFKISGSLIEQLIQFGGHKAAAGLEIEIDKIDEFRRRFNEILKINMEEDDIIPEIKVDSKISLCEITPKFVRVLDQFAPFGPGNMRPVFWAEDVKIVNSPRIVGTNHFVATFCQNGTEKVYDAIGFNLGKFVYEVDKNKDLVDIVFTIEKVVKDYG